MSRQSHAHRRFPAGRGLLGQDGLHHVRRLARTCTVSRALRRVEVGDEPARLQRHAGVAGEVIRCLDHRRRVREGAWSTSPATTSRRQARLSPSAGWITGVVRIQRRLGIGDDRQLFPVDLDLSAHRVFGDSAVLGDDGEPPARPAKWHDRRRARAVPASAGPAGSTRRRPRVDRSRPGRPVTVDDGDNARERAWPRQLSIAPMRRGRRGCARRRRAPCAAARHRRRRRHGRRPAASRSAAARCARHSCSGGRTASGRGGRSCTPPPRRACRTASTASTIA